MYKTCKHKGPWLALGNYLPEVDPDKTRMLCGKCNEKEINAFYDAQKRKALADKVLDRLSGVFTE